MNSEERAKRREKIRNEIQEALDQLYEDCPELRMGLSIGNHPPTTLSRTGWTTADDEAFDRACRGDRR